VVKKKNMKSKDEIVPVTVFSGTIYEAEMVKSLLENADIVSERREYWDNGTLVFCPGRRRIGLGGCPQP